MTAGDRSGRAAVHYGVVDGDVAGVRVALAEVVADPGAADGDVWTPLHFGAQAQEPVIVEELLGAGTSVCPGQPGQHRLVAGGLQRSG